jgi:hypothetical protein
MSMCVCLFYFLIFINFVVSFGYLAVNAVLPIASDENREGKKMNKQSKQRNKKKLLKQQAGQGSNYDYIVNK